MERVVPPATQRASQALLKTQNSFSFLIDVSVPLKRLVVEVFAVKMMAGIQVQQEVCLWGHKNFELLLLLFQKEYVVGGGLMWTFILHIRLGSLFSGGREESQTKWCWVCPLFGLDTGVCFPGWEVHSTHSKSTQRRLYEWIDNEKLDLNQLI